MSLRPLFVTQLYEASLASDRGFAAFRDELLDAVAMLAEGDRAGRAWCKDNGYRGYTSYASLNDLPTRATVFRTLLTKLDRHVAAYAEALHLDLGGKKLKCDSLWVNVLRPGGAHSGHIHPHSVVSGTFYADVPAGSSALKLEDPRLPLMMAAPPPLDTAPESARPFVYITPADGTVLLWESWLRHEVPPNAAKSERVSVSFNYAWR